MTTAAPCSRSAPVVTAATAYPVPDRLNAALVAFTVVGWAGLVWLAGRVEGGAALTAVVVAFALLFQTNFALLHEAAHLRLHSDRARGRALGFVCGGLFGASCAMMEVTHWSHHLKNRSDQESFDLVLPGQARLPRALGWYGVLLGLLWPATLALSLLLLVAPGAAERLARRARVADRLFDEGPARLRRVRLELLLGLLLHAGLLVLLATPPARVLLLYAAGGLLWSSTNYLEHAFAPRDVVRGAFNLRAPWPYGWINLHREWDLNHHLHPEVPWLYLPRLPVAAPPRRSWVAHWLSQWGGPRCADGAGPAPLDEAALPAALAAARGADGAAP